MRVNHRGRLIRSVCRYTGRTPVGNAAPRRAPRRRPSPRIKADRSSLLLTTALASTLIAAGLFAPTPAFAVVACVQPPSPTPIADTSATDAITCDNVDPRDGIGVNAIDLSTTGANHYIDLYNGGLLTTTIGGRGIDTDTTGDNSFIAIENVGDIDAIGIGISANTTGNATSNNSNAGITIDNIG